MSSKNKIGIVGSRTFNDYEYMKQCLKEIFSIKKIISGGAKGADKLAERYADEYKIPLQIHFPDWEQYGKSAAFKRNNLIVEDSDIIVAFWNNKSKGTMDTITKAKKAGKPVFIYEFKDD